MAVRKNAEQTTDIETINDTGANTTAEVRKHFTKVKDTVFNLAPSEAFKTLLRNQAGYPMTLIYDGNDYIATKMLSTSEGSILFAYTYVNGWISTITASGAGFVASGVTVNTKTYSYDGSGKLLGTTHFNVVGNGTSLSGH